MDDPVFPHRFVAAVCACVVLFAGCRSDDDTATDETTAAGTDARSETTAATDATVPATDPPATDAPTADSPTSDAPTTDAPTTDPVAAAEGWSMDAVGPGTFATTVMEPGFTLTYGDGWVPFMPESRNQLNIEVPESSELGCAPCALLGVSAAEADSPDDVVDFARANGLELSDSEQIDVGGITGERYQVTGGEGLVFESEFSEFGVDSAEGPARFTVLEAGDRVIVIHELANPEVVDTVWAMSDDVVSSIEWSDA